MARARLAAVPIIVEDVAGSYRLGRRDRISLYPAGSVAEPTRHGWRRILVGLFLPPAQQDPRQIWGK